MPPLSTGSQGRRRRKPDLVVSCALAGAGCGVPCDAADVAAAQAQVTKIPVAQGAQLGKRFPVDLVACPTRRDTIHQGAQKGGFVGRRCRKGDLIAHALGFLEECVSVVVVEPKLGVMLQVHNAYLYNAAMQKPHKP